MSVLTDLKELIRRRAVVGHFVSTTLKTGHRDKVLGNLWQLIDPLSFMLVYYVVWSIILGRRGPEFMLYLLSGIIVFRLFQDSVLGASGVLRSQVRLIREVYFPKAALPTAVAIARLNDFAWALAALIMLEVFFLHRQAHLTPEALAKIHHPLAFGWSILWLPLVVLALFLFSLGVSFMSAIAGVFFRDTPNILGFVFRLWFYLSPIFYYPEDVRRLSTKVWFFYRINPFSHFFRLLRASLIYDKPPGLDGMLYICIISVAALVIGFVIFSKCEGTAIKQL